MKLLYQNGGFSDKNNKLDYLIMVQLQSSKDARKLIEASILFKNHEYNITYSNENFKILANIRTSYECSKKFLKRLHL